MIKACSHALAGLDYAYNKEQNLRIEIMAACLALGGGILLRISSFEWCMIIICIALVLSMEIVNTAIERLCNRLHAGYDKEIGVIKDLAAAAVLLVALMSAVCGAIIFVPKIIYIFKS